MLTKREAKWNIFCLFICSWIGVLPLTVDRETGRMSTRISRSRTWIWRCGFALNQVHLIYMAVRLVQVCLVPLELLRMDHLVVHSTILAASSVTHYWLFELLIQHPLEMAMIFNELFARFGPEFQSTSYRPFFSLKFKYNLHELMILTMPVAMLGSILLVSAMLFSDSTQKLLMYSCVPSQYQNWTVFIGLTTIDSLHYVFFVLPITLLSLTSQMLFFQRCDLIFKSYNRRLEKIVVSCGAKDFRKLLKNIRHLNLCIHFFNLSYSFVIFSWKITVLEISIFAGFFTIRYHDDYPLTATFTGYCGTIITLWHLFVYGTEFKVLENFKKLKMELSRKAMISKHKAYLKKSNVTEFQKKIRSIREIGIRVGCYHYLERLSNLTFINYIVDKVTGLLIAYR